MWEEMRRCLCGAAHLHNVPARVSGLQVAVGVGGAVAAVVDALALALVALAVGLRADPHDVVRREARPVALQLPRHRHKLLQRTREQSQPPVDCSPCEVHVLQGQAGPAASSVSTQACSASGICRPLWGSAAGACMRLTALLLLKAFSPHCWVQCEIARADHLDKLPLHVAHCSAHVIAVCPELPLHLHGRDNGHATMQIQVTKGTRPSMHHCTAAPPLHVLSGT